ncbi:MAG: DUF6691 family protein [Anaerolineae bacterium]|nr:DUF6691 family protein [Anaerolineae bacterium]
MELSTHQPQIVAPVKKETVLQLATTLLTGFFFGIVLVKSEVASWFRIQNMFLFQEAHMYLVIFSAVVVGVISLFLIKKFQLRTIEHQEITVPPNRFHKGIIYGGATFGLGWAITGACPGPIYAQIGIGESMAWVTFISALAGMYTYAVVRSKLPH